MMRMLWIPVQLLLLMLQSAWLALGQIWANKTRSALTTIGIVIGVASVTAVIAALSGLKASVLKEFESFGTTTIFAGPDRPREGRFKNIPWHKLQFEPEDFDGILDSCPSLEMFTPASWNSQTVRFGEKSVDGMLIRGVNSNWHQIEKRSVVQGRPFSAIDEEQGWQVCLITPEVQKDLKLDKDCLGQQIQVDGRSFQIVGVVEERVSQFEMGRSQSEIYVPYLATWKLWRAYPMLLAKSRTPEQSEDAREEIRFFLRKIKRLKPEDPDLFVVRSVEQALQVINKIMLITTAISGGIVGISLLVGGVGILYIMLGSVAERTRAIGLRKAVGASPSAILLQFLVEAVILCFLGGMIGVLCGEILTSVLTVVLNKIPNMQQVKAYIPLWAIALSFGFSAIVGIVFGMFPAIKASRLDPIEALRHE